MSVSATTTSTSYLADVEALHAAIRKATPQLKPWMAYSGTIIDYAL